MDSPEEGQTDINEEIGAAACDEEDAEGWDCEVDISAAVLVNMEGSGAY